MTNFSPARKSSTLALAVHILLCLSSSFTLFVLLVATIRLKKFDSTHRVASMIELCLSSFPKLVCVLEILMAFQIKYEENTFYSIFQINSTKLSLCHGVIPQSISYNINPNDQISHLAVYYCLFKIWGDIYLSNLVILKLVQWGPYDRIHYCIAICYLLCKPKVCQFESIVVKQNICWLNIPVDDLVFKQLFQSD